jgi:hypothetical protein
VVYLGDSDGCFDEGNNSLVFIKISNVLSSSVVVRFLRRSVFHEIVCLFVSLG